MGVGPTHFKNNTKINSPNKSTQTFGKDMGYHLVDYLGNKANIETSPLKGYVHICDRTITICN